MSEQKNDLARELHSQLTKKQLLELCLVRLDRINELRRENLILKGWTQQGTKLIRPVQKEGEKEV